MHGPNSRSGSTILSIRATSPGVRRAAVSIACVVLLWLVGLAHVLAHEDPAPPKVLHEEHGRWPAGIQPTTDVVVPMLVTVSPEGALVDCIIDVSLGPALDAAALEAARSWRFQPAIVNGKAVAARARIAVRFHGPALDLDAGALVALPARGEEGADAGVSADAGSAEPDAAVTNAAARFDAGPAPDATASNANDAQVARTAALPDARAAEDDVASATARGERARRSASEVTRDRAVLSAAPHRTASDLLQTVPGAFVTQHGGEGKANQIFYRGFDAVHGQDVELWVGGAPVNEVSNVHGQGYADLHFVMPEVVRTLRASPGTYDPRQGDFAVAGTMRFELGYDQPGITAKGGYGSFGTQRYFLAYRPKGAPEETFGAAEFYDTDGFGPSRKARRASAIAQGRWRSGATSVRLLLSGYAGHFNSAGVVRLSDLQSGKISRFHTYDPNQGGASMRAQLVGEVTHRFGDHGVFGIAPYLVLRTLRLRQNFTGALFDERGDSSQQLNEAITLGGQAYYRMKLRLFSPADGFELGLSVRSDWVEQSQRRLGRLDQKVLDTEVDARVRGFDVGGYLDVVLHPLSPITLRAGVRIDGLAYYAQDRANGADGQARASQGVHVGPKATLEGRIVRGLSALVSYGQGFRSPQARQLAESETTPFTRVWSLEGGLRYVREEQLELSAAGFRTWLSDDLVFDPARSGANIKTPATQRTGVTVDGTYRPLPWLVANAHVTYTRAEFRRSNADFSAGFLLPYVPQLVARIDAAATPVLGEWLRRKLVLSAGAGFSALARRPLPESQWGHDIFLVDAQAGLRWGEVGLSIKAFNVLGSNWYDGEFLFASQWESRAPSLLEERHVTVGAPRTLLATLEIYL
jgi:iron complex outermembrane receptor protein